MLKLLHSSWFYLCFILNTVALHFTLFQVAYADDSRITASVNRDHISAKQTVSVNVVTEVVGTTAQARLIEPAWSEQGWQVLGRSQMTQMQIINRATSLEVTYTYQLRPIRQGELKIGPFKGAGTAQGLTSNVLKIKVSDQAPARSQAEKARNDQYAQIKWEVDQQEVWLGERIEASLVVYVRNKLRLTDLSVPDINLQGFWAEEAEPPRRSPYVSLGGVTYSQKVIKRDLLTPLKAGDLSLPSFDVNLVVGTHSFFTETQEVPQTVPALNIKVKPLPPNPPKGFKGPTVGQVQLTATIDRSRIRIDEGIQLNIQTTTTGLLANTPAIELPYLDGLKVFPPTERTMLQNLGGKERSVRTQTWLIKPERAGEFHISQIALPYFNLQKGEYDFARTRALKFTVLGHQGQKVQQGNTSLTQTQPSVVTQAQPMPGQAKTATPNAAEQLGIHLKSIMTEQQPALQQSLPRELWWLIGLLGPLALLWHELKMRLSSLSQRNASSKAQSRAGKEAIKAIQKIELNHFDFGVLDEAFTTYLEARFQFAVRGLTREQTSETLQNEGLSKELISGYQELAEVIDFARFAPGAKQNQGQEAQRLAQIWIKLAEEQLKENKKPDLKKVSPTSLLFMLLSLILMTSFSQVLYSPTSFAEPSKKELQHEPKSAEEAFWSGHYQAAVELYQDRLKSQKADPTLWYNLGTAYAYQGQFGQASYALHRAEILAPHDLQISEQISLLNQAISEDGVRHPGQRRLVLPDEMTSGGGLLALFTVAMSEAFALSCLSLACFALLAVRRQSLKSEPGNLELKDIKKIASLRALAVIFFVLTLLASISWWAKKQSEAIDRGIVVANRAALYRGPGSQYEVEVNIAGGVKLELQGQRENWQRVKLSDGREGWMSLKDIEALP